MASLNELNNDQLMKVNMIDLVKTNFYDPDNVLVYNTNLVIKNKIIAFGNKDIDLRNAITKKIHDKSGDSPEKIGKKHALANYLSRKGKASSVYYKEQGLVSIEFLLHKEPYEIFAMTDSVIISYAGDVKSRLNTDVLLLAGYGVNPGVVTLIGTKTTDFSDIKTTPKSDQVSKDTGGDEVDAAILDQLDILQDLDNLIPDAFIDTNEAMVTDYEAKRVEITVGTRHTILNVSMRIKPALTPAAGATFTIKNAENVIVKVLHMDDIHGASETILRMAEYTGITHLDGYIDKTQVFRPNYRSHLDLGFDLDPIV